MSIPCTLSQIADILRDEAHRRFVVMSHVRPDGDAIGCTVALALCLKAMGKEVVAWNHDGPLEKLAFLPDSALVTKPPKAPESFQDFDVAIAVDTSTHPRLGEAPAAVRSAKIWLNIDHHVSNTGYGDLVHVDPDAPATGQVLFELIQQNGLPLTREIAENLWAAIATDTGSFQYSNTTARTFEIGAALIRAGVEVGPISTRLFQTEPLRRLELIRTLLNGLRLHCGNRVASFALTRAALEAAHALPEDTEGLIDTLRSIDGVLIAVFLEEMTPPGSVRPLVRVSMRSKDPRYDVCAVCAQFGGGGHTQAAGARVEGLLSEIEPKIIQAICDSIH